MIICIHLESNFQSVNIMNINTFVFFDIETTGFRRKGVEPNITELAFVACKRQHIIDATIGVVPRVLFKLVLPINPMDRIPQIVANLTGNLMISFPNSNWQFNVNL